MAKKKMSAAQSAALAKGRQHPKAKSVQQGLKKRGKGSK